MQANFYFFFEGVLLWPELVRHLIWVLLYTQIYTLTHDLLDKIDLIYILTQRHHNDSRVCKMNFAYSTRLDERYKRSSATDC